MKYVYLSILSLLAGYILVLIFIYLNQRNLLYHPAENNYLDDKLEFNHEEIRIETEKNIKLKIFVDTVNEKLISKNLIL